MNGSRTGNAGRTIVAAIVLGLGVAWANPAGAEEAAALALARMPIQEVTVFKDGHALVVHAGKMPTGPAGDVVMDYLPTPIMGTFWPYCSDKAAMLTAVVAGRRRVKIERTATTVRALLEANVGAEVLLKEIVTGPDGKPLWALLSATILGVPTISSDELAATSPPGSGEALPVKGKIILLKTAEGTRAMPLDRIQEVTFKGAHKAAVGSEEFRNLLTLKLDWAGRPAGKAAEVGMMYVQRGLRWIPNYKIDIDGKGAAVVKLQAEILNELADLNDVTCNLVIGVPNFAFKDTLDPISLQQTVARLSQYFQEGSQVAGQFSNAIMTQAVRMREVPRRRPQRAPAADLGPEIGGAERSEDLFVFTVRHVTLRKGQRMVLPVAEFTLQYKDVYLLDIPFVPPAEVFRNFNSQQQAQIARLLAAPKVMHNIRLVNKSEYPLTTAPALIVQGPRVLAQSMMTYTAIGGTTDLEITAAVDVQVRKQDTETKRTPNAAQWQGNQYARADLAGTISLTNFRKEPVTLEVVRNVLGNATKADHDGKVEMVNILEDATFAGSSYGRGRPHWWGWHNWPYWWRHFNGVGRITWDLTLEPGKTADLKYEWNYYWR